MSSNEESIEEKITENQKKEEEEEEEIEEPYENELHYASSDFLMNIIPKNVNKKKFDDFFSKLLIKKLSSIKNLLEIEPKSTSEFLNFLIFLTEIKKEYYIGAGKILICSNRQ